MKYKISGRTFVQSKLKLGQMKQLLPYFDKIATALGNNEDVNLIDFVDKIKDDISEIVAIVLVEEGQNLKDKDVKELSAFLDDNMEYDMLLDIVADFFTLTPIGLIGDKIEKIRKSISSKADSKKKETG